MFSCSKSEQKQLNTWVSFQSAEQPLLGQLSVSGNRVGNHCRIGSSEITVDVSKDLLRIHCRTGSGTLVRLGIELYGEQVCSVRLLFL
ncbi:hypothetical protein B1R45_14080 [Pseudomonas azotoformans]|nr:hypothetical protein B1R45_14080 [Pseudomonas azotoformans]